MEKIKVGFPKGRWKYKEDIKQMRERHRKEIELLQNGCKHTNFSDWMEEQWAPAHSAGSLVRLCNFCEKVVERKGLKTVFYGKT